MIGQDLCSRMIALSVLVGGAQQVGKSVGRFLKYTRLEMVRV